MGKIQLTPAEEKAFEKFLNEKEGKETEKVPEKKIILYNVKYMASWGLKCATL